MLVHCLQSLRVSDHYLQFQGSMPMSILSVCKTYWSGYSFPDYNSTTLTVFEANPKIHNVNAATTAFFVWRAVASIDCHIQDRCKDQWCGRRLRDCDEFNDNEFDERFFRQREPSSCTMALSKDVHVGSAFDSLSQLHFIICGADGRLSTIKDALFPSLVDLLNASVPLKGDLFVSIVPSCRTPLNHLKVVCYHH